MNKWKNLDNERPAAGSANKVFLKTTDPRHKEDAYIGVDYDIGYFGHQYDVCPKFHSIVSGEIQTGLLRGFTYEWKYVEDETGDENE